MTCDLGICAPSDVIQELQLVANTADYFHSVIAAVCGIAATATMDLILKPVRVATSKPARQTYLNTLLFIVTSTILFIFAVIAYVLFYYNYIPQIGVERVIHLQYGYGLHPYGIAKLDSSLVSQQAYDVRASIHLPRSPPNVAQGNFMLRLDLLRSSFSKQIPAPGTGPISLCNTKNKGITCLTDEDTILTSRRPAIMAYTSRLISLSERLLSLPLYVTGLRRESEILQVPLAESIQFEKGWNNVPAYLLLELQAGQDVQVYDVQVHFTARFGGLRWLMYNHRIISFAVFTSAFWTAEILFTVFGWVILRTLLVPAEDKSIKKASEQDTEGETGSTTVKKEHDDRDTDEPDLSDTPRTFPTYGRQQPLRYEPKIKDEDSEEYIIDETAIQPLTAEADDEDEDGHGRAHDSGLGTSFSEGGGRGGSARRRSRGGRVGS